MEEETMGGNEPWWAISRMNPGSGFEPTASTHPDALVIHAKRLGDPFTACGLRTFAWHNHWAQFSQPVGQAHCAECRRTVDARRSPDTVPRSSAAP
jgi:hypothetical protein